MAEVLDAELSQLLGAPSSATSLRAAKRAASGAMVDLRDPLAHFTNAHILTLLLLDGERESPIVPAGVSDYIESVKPEIDGYLDETEFEQTPRVYPDADQIEPILNLVNYYARALILESGADREYDDRDGL